MYGEIRRVQLTGGATLIVSLPKDWAKRIALTPGDEVLIIPQPDDTLVLIPRKLGKRAGVVAEIRIESPIKIEELEKLFMALYIGGAETITINFAPSTTHLRKLLKDYVRRRIIDMEIVEESSERLVIQSMVATTELTIIDIIAKMAKLTHNMLDDLIKALDLDDVGLLKDIVERDDEVDRLYWLMERQLKRAAMSRNTMLELKIPDPRDIVEYMIIAKSIERIADHICRISYVNQEEKIDVRIVKPVLLRDTEYLSRIPPLLAEDVSSTTLAELYEDVTAWTQKIRKESIPSDPTTSVAKESALRIGEYVGDILESLIHIKLKDKALTIK